MTNETGNAKGQELLSTKQSVSVAVILRDRDYPEFLCLSR